MKKLAAALALVLATAPFALAHGGNEHVRGTVTQVSPTSVTVQSADKKSHTLNITAKTTLKQGTKAMKVSDLKVGDRVVVDVPEKTTDALLIQMGAAPAAANAAKH